MAEKRCRTSLAGGLFLLFLLLSGASRLAAQEVGETAPEKEFHWREIAVQARLEADGSVSVRERQDYLFTGDYNGGERGFDLRMRQRLDFQKISRLYGDAWKPLTEGDLSQVDQYSWPDSSRIRWRSRQPQDPPFASTPLSYLLEYRITNVVFSKGEGYGLGHDFLFPEREAKVERFTLDLEIDPAWQVRGEWQRHHTAGPLWPGQGYVVDLDLEWSGAGEAPVYRARPPFLPALLAIVLAIAGGLFYLLRAFVKRQGELGRFAALPSLPAGQEPAWLEQNLLSLRAEEVGAFWDRKVGPPEVAALIARWVAEGKLQSRVEEKAGGAFGFGKERILHLELLVGKNSFEPYERQLLDELFFDSRTRIDTKAIQTYYKDTGFDPAGTLRQGLEDRLAARPGWEEKKERAPARKPTALLFLAGIATLFADFLFDTEGAFFSAFFFFVPLIVIYVISAIVGVMFRSQTSRLGLGTFLISLMPAGYLLLLTLFALSGPIEMDQTFSWSPSYLTLVGYGLLLLSIYRSVLNIASSRETRDGIAWRRWLAAARQYLAAELRREQPGFSDAFFPYLLAFGLEKDVDRWFSSFGGAAAAAATRTTTSSGGSFGGYSSSGGSGGFTGGGGMFGGGGASASWAAAATSVASGVAAPSQSSSSGGSSGGSSSGGGSGGAW